MKIVSFLIVLYVNARPMEKQTQETLTETRTISITITKIVTNSTTVPELEPISFLIDSTNSTLTSTPTVPAPAPKLDASQTVSTTNISLATPLDPGVKNPAIQDQLPTVKAEIPQAVASSSRIPPIINTQPKKLPASPVKSNKGSDQQLVPETSIDSNIIFQGQVKAQENPVIAVSLPAIAAQDQVKLPENSPNGEPVVSTITSENQSKPPENDREKTAIIVAADPNPAINSDKQSSARSNSKFPIAAVVSISGVVILAVGGFIYKKKGRNSSEILNLKDKDSVPRPESFEESTRTNTLDWSNQSTNDQSDKTFSTATTVQDNLEFRRSDVYSNGVRNSFDSFKGESCSSSHLANKALEKASYGSKSHFSVQSDESSDPCHLSVQSFIDSFDFSES